MNADCRSCSTCLNNDAGVCSISIKQVKPTDHCSYWENEDDMVMKERIVNRKKNTRNKKHFKND